MYKTLTRLKMSIPIGERHLKYAKFIYKSDCVFLNIVKIKMLVDIKN